MPLAIYCNGNDIEICEAARQSENQGVPGYYDDIFIMMQKQAATFNFRGEDYPISKLLLFAIEKEFDYFFSRILYNEEGAKEDHKATLPICFLFDFDMSIDTRKFVIRLFKKAGYINVDEIVLSQSAYKAVENEKNGYDKCVVVSSVEGKVYGALSWGKAQWSPFEICAMGADPKVDCLSKLIWNCIEQQGGGYLSYQKEYPAIWAIAKKYKNHQGNIQSSVKLSDDYDYYFDIPSNSIANVQSETIDLQILKNTIAQSGCNMSDVAIVMVGFSDDEEHIHSAFAHEFSIVKVSNDDVYNRILSLLISKNFVLSTQPSEISSTPINTISQRTSTSNITDEGLNSIVEGYQKRIARAKRQWPHMTSSKVLEEIDSFLSSAHGEGIYNFDEELVAERAKYEKKSQKTETNEPKEFETQVPGKPDVDPKSFKREVNIEIRGSKVANADVAYNNLTELLNKLHRNNVHVYDDELKEAIDSVEKRMTGNDTKGSSSTNTSSSNAAKFAREVRMLKRQCAQMRPEKAVEEIDNLLSKLHNESIRDYDEELNAERVKYEGIVPKPDTKVKTRVEDKPKPKEDPAKFKREVNIAIRESRVQTNKAEALMSLNRILDKLHRLNIFDYDDQINKAIKAKQ